MNKVFGLTKDSSVLTKSGWKQISKLQVGDMVYTRDNVWAGIKRIKKSKPTGKILSLKTEHGTVRIGQSQPVWVTSLQKKSKSGMELMEVRKLVSFKQGKMGDMVEAYTVMDVGQENEQITRGGSWVLRLDVANYTGMMYTLQLDKGSSYLSRAVMIGIED